MFTLLQHKAGFWISALLIFEALLCWAVMCTVGCWAPSLILPTMYQEDPLGQPKMSADTKLTQAEHPLLRSPYTILTPAYAWQTAQQGLGSSYPSILFTVTWSQDSFAPYRSTMWGCGHMEAGGRSSVQTQSWKVPETRSSIPALCMSAPFGCLWFWLNSCSKLLLVPSVWACRQPIHAPSIQPQWNRSTWGLANCWPLSSCTGAPADPCLTPKWKRIISEKITYKNWCCQYLKASSDFRGWTQHRSQQRGSAGPVTY